VLYDYYFKSLAKLKEEQQHAEFSNCCCSFEPLKAKIKRGRRRKNLHHTNSLLLFSFHAKSVQWKEEKQIFPLFSSTKKRTIARIEKIYFFSCMLPSLLFIKRRDNTSN